MTSRPVRLVALLAALLLLAAACGRDDNKDTSSGGGGTTGEVKTGPGFDGTTIKLGVITPLSGPVAPVFGLPITAGNQVYFDKVNAAGGVAGKYKVELVKEDNVYDPAQTKTKYDKIKGDVAMFGQILGTPPTKAVLADLKRDGIVASPASLDAAWVREPNLLPIGSTYQIQFINAADYLINTKGFKGKPICMVAVEGEYGDAGIEGLTFAAKELKFDIAVTARYKPTDQDFTAQVQQLKNGKCAAVFLTSLPTQTAQIIGAAAQQGLTPQWVGQSPTWAGALAKSQVAPVLEKTFLWTSEGATWGDTSVPGMKQMLDDIAKYLPAQQPDVYFVFGYVQAIAVNALLEQAVENGDLSRAGILKAIEDLSNVDYKGLLGKYTYGKASERDPSRETVLFSVDPTVPGALKKVVAVSSDAAKKLEFKAAS